MKMNTKTNNKMLADMNVYPIKQPSGFDVNKSKIFAFQKSVNDIFNIKSNVITTVKNRQISNDVQQELSNSLQKDLHCSWSMTDNVVTDYVLPEQTKIIGTTTMKTFNNMDNLLQYFNSTEDFPEYYLGKADKMALCRCPQTGEESWNNINYLLNKQPRKNTIVKAQINVMDTVYEKDFIFVKWETENFYEWKMKSGNVLQLRQKFIDGLKPRDKKYLRMHT
jgi:hypothetical protein